MLVEQGFQPPSFVLGPAWDSNHVLKALLRRRLPVDVYDRVAADLERFQERIAGREQLWLHHILDTR
jgi:hypothetical protein